MKKISRIGVLTSGGDAPGMNAAIRAVVRSGINRGLEVFGIRMGYQGMIEGDIAQMQSEDVSGIIQMGGTILQTARCQEFHSKARREESYKQLERFGIDAVVAIGGDGTLKGANAMARESNIAVVGIPGTIDNDIYGTDYTIGYDTALNTVTEAVDKIRDTASAHNRIFFVEVMGHEAGFVAINSGIACGAEVIMVPEKKNQLDHVRGFLRERARKNRSSIIIVAEGLAEGGAMKIANTVASEFPQFDIRVSILGYIQRGGSPSNKDRIVASLMGVAAVKALIADKKSVMVGWRNEQVTYVPLSKSIKLREPVSDEMLSIADEIGNFIPDDIASTLHKKL